MGSDFLREPHLAAAEVEMLLEQVAQVGVLKLVHHGAGDELCAVPGPVQSPEEIDFIGPAGKGFVESVDRVECVEREGTVGPVREQAVGHRGPEQLAGAVQQGAVRQYPIEGATAALGAAAKRRPVGLNPSGVNEIVGIRQQNYAAPRRGDTGVAGDVDADCP